VKRGAALSLAALLLTACQLGGPQGRDLTFQEASTYFATHRADLETLVALLDACRPVTPGGDTWVWRDRARAKRCARGDPDNLERIAAWLQAENFAGAGYYTADRDPLGPFAGAEVVTRVSGLGVSGAMTKLSYVADARPVALGVERREDGSVMSETRGLGSEPFRWFWEHAQ
jgi:hypothetical protein